MPKRSHHLDVAWYLPGGKRPFVYSTVATSKLLALLCEQTDGHTAEEILPLINYDEDAKKIMREYIKRGFGNHPLNLRY